MYKKLLYTLVVLGFLAFQVANAQVCVPDPQFTQPGIYPDTVTGFADGCAGKPYEQLITNVVPADTFVDPPGVFVIIDSVVLSSVAGLPPGFTYQCEPASCSWPGGSTGCVI
ncbi:MAG: hypothetical protein IIA88_05570, partial [Bacteroidetes bacterium]|nr:hypothetical protein [Bacteroidota bacterium]